MALAHFFCIVSVEHDGLLTGSEMCEVLGQAITDWELEVTGTTHDGLAGTLSIEECLGVDECHPDSIAELIQAAKEAKDGNEQPPLEPSS